MDKQEYRLKAEEIKTLISKRKFQEAVKIADEIDWTRVRSVAMLCTVSDLYKVNRRYKESKELLLMAYERHPGGRMILYSLCELCIKMGEVVQAIEYYKEFVQLAPMDNGKYILQYKLYEAQEVSLEERIAVLEELKRRDYREKWGYELAYLYHRIGLGTKCVEECDQLILWFSEGRYVKKAMELKMLHQPLSPVQQDSYERLMGGKKETPPPQQKVEETPQEEELDIQVQPMKMGKYDTINLQKALAESMKEVLSKEEPVPVQESAPLEEPLSVPQMGTVTSQIMASMYDTGTSPQEVVYPEHTEEVAQELKPDEFPAVQKTVKESVPAPEAETEEPVLQEVKEQEAVPATPMEAPSEPQIQQIPVELVKEPQASASSASMAEEITKEIPSIKEIMKRPLIQPVQEEVPAQMANLLSQDYDGQISLVVPEESRVEKQITGQMNIDEVLVEWEKTKREHEEKRKAELTQKVLAQTGSMFSDFDAKVRDGILEQLEKEELSQGKKAAQGKILAYRNETPEIEELSEGEILSEEVEELEEREEPAVDLEELVQPEGRALASIKAVEAEEFAEEMLQEEIPGAGTTEREEETDIEIMEEEPGPEEAASEANFDEAGEEPFTEEPSEEPSMEESEETGGGEDSTQEPAQDYLQEEIRELTEEEKSLFGPFIQTRGGRKRFMKALDLISLAAYTGNVIITGEAAAGTVTLAKNIMKDIQMTDANFSGVIAKVSGASLNSRNIDSTVSKLNNGGLIVEKASGMNSQAVMKLLKALNQEQSGIVVILEDNKKAIKRMLAAYPSMATFFNARIEIEELNNDALAAYGRQYAYHLEYAIDELGMLALQTRIEDRQTSDHIVTVAEVRELVDEAIANANRKNPQHFFDMILGKRYNEEDMVILREKDFI